MRYYAWLWLVWLGCQGEEPAEQALDAGPVPDVVVGSFNVSLVAPSATNSKGHTSVVGKVYDGPSPSQTIWEEAAREGDCQLLLPRTPFCSSSCGGSAVCVEDETCEDYPNARSVGSVRVRGAKTSSGTTEFTMEPIANNYQPKAGIQLPFPAFAPGAELRLQSSGGDYAPFELRAQTIAPLELTSTEFRLEPDRPLELRWEPAETSGDSRILVKLDISHHGGSKGKLVCDLPDTGAAQLPAALISHLLERGVAGFPSVILTRQSSDEAEIAVGRVALEITSQVERLVGIEGLSSCTRSADCPSGKSCQADLTCQ